MGKPGDCATQLGPPNGRPTKFAKPRRRRDSHAAPTWLPGTGFGGARPLTNKAGTLLKNQGNGRSDVHHCHRQAQLEAGSERPEAKIVVESGRCEQEARPFRRAEFHYIQGDKKRHFTK